MPLYEEEESKLLKLHEMMAEIPSDPESEDDEEDDNESNNDIQGTYVLDANNYLVQIDDSEEPNNNLGQLSDNDHIEDTLPSDNETEAGTSGNYNGRPASPRIDSDDDTPLAVRLYRQGVIWSVQYPHVLKNDNFYEFSGPKIKDVEEPLDIFLSLFPPDLIDRLVFETNLYCTQKMGGAVLGNPTNSEEMRTFLGINLLMGIKKLPYYRDYWSSSLEMRDQYISSAMSVNRFGWFLSNLHVNDNDAMPRRDSAEFDKLYKVRPLLQKLSETYENCYAPSEFQAVDESMIPFKGRSCLKQYMPDKPTKRGYKLWVRADSFGYIMKFQIYEGKRNNITEKNLGSRVIKELTSELTGLNYTVYFDNYFSSVDLMIYLQQNKIKACGTTRANRTNFPKDFSTDKDMSRGTSEWKSTRTGIVAVKWKDRRGIHFLSNFHDPTQMSTVNRKEKDGSIKALDCPQLVKDYNAHMGYVDKADMLKTIYAIDRKSRKWWHRIFFHMLDTTVVNAFVIYSHLTEGKKLSLKEFRLAVARSLIGIPTREHRGRKSTPKKNSFKINVPQEIRYSKAEHMPISSTSRRCHVCSARAEVHRSKWACSTCNVALCLNEVNNCFRNFHRK